MYNHVKIINNPVKFIEQLEQELGDKKYVQDPPFNYESESFDYLENIYPDSPLFSPTTESWEIGRGEHGNDGIVANIIGFAGTKHKQFTVENIIYPKTISKTGCYCIKLPFEEDDKEFWVVIDSRVPISNGDLIHCMPITNDAGIWGSVLEKYAASIMGNLYSELSNDRKTHHIFPGFFDHILIDVSEFSDVVNAIYYGAYAIIRFSCHYDDNGNDLPGISSNYAYALVNAMAMVDTSNIIHNLVRIEDPHIDGTDYESEYSDTSEFWEENSDYMHYHDESSATKGNWWMSWDDLLELNHTNKIPFKCPIPLKHRGLTYEYSKKIIIDLSTITDVSDRNPSLKQLRRKTKPIRIKTTGSAFFVAIKLLTNNQTTQIYGYFTDSKNNFIHQLPRKEMGSISTKYYAMDAGEYLIFPATKNMKTDTGLIEISIHSQKEFELTYNGKAVKLSDALLRA